MSRMKHVPVYPKYRWNGERILGVKTDGCVTSLFDFDVYSLCDMLGVKDFLSKLHIGKFTDGKPDLLLAIEASDFWVNVYVGNSVNIFIPYAYLRLVKCKPNKHARYAKSAKWKLYEANLY